MDFRCGFLFHGVSLFAISLRKELECARQLDIVEWNRFSVAIYDALRDKSRRLIIDLMFREPRTAGYLSDKVKISRAAIDKHLARLMEMGVIDKIHYSKPRSHYKYELTEDAKTLVYDLEEAVTQYVASQLDIIHRKLEFLEQGFLLGYMPRQQYEEEKQALTDKRESLVGTNGEDI